MPLVFELWFLFYICVILPRGAWRSRKMVTAGQVAMTPKRLFLFSLASMGFLGLMTFVTAWQAGIDLFPRRPITMRDALIGLASLFIRYDIVAIRIRIGATDRVTRAMAPRTAMQAVATLGIIVIAAVVEECAYRGVAFVVLIRLIGNAWMAALISALAFGLAHLLQGTKAAMLVVFYGLIDQTVVVLTGSLYVAMITHFLYDATVLMVLKRRSAAPIEGEIPYGIITTIYGGLLALPFLQRDQLRG